MTHEKNIYFLRHGETTLKNRYVGALDVPLSAIGSKQVNLLGVTLQNISFDYVFCSPMLRCRQTLDLLELHSPCEYNDIFKEIDFGQWEGKTFTEIVHSDKKLVDKWSLEPDCFCFPGGESLVDFQKRISHAKEIIALCEHSKILVVAHGGVIRYLLCYFLQLSVKNYLIFDVQPGKISQLRLYPEGGVLSKFNYGA